MEAGQKETKSLRSLYVRVLNALRNQNSGVNRPLNQSTGPPRFKIQIFLVSFVYMFHVDLCGNSWYMCSQVETILLQHPTCSCVSIFQSGAFIGYPGLRAGC